MASRSTQGLAFAFFAYAAWGLLSPVGKHLLSDFGPLWLNAVRFLIATVVALPFLGARESVRLLRRPEILSFNFLANASLTFFLYSLVLLPATFATLGFYTAPLWTAVLAWRFLGEHVGRWFLPAVAALLGGGYLALFGWKAPDTSLEPVGLVLATLSAVVWGLYTVELREHAPNLALRPLMGASFLFGTLWYGGLALVLEPTPVWADVAPSTWAWMGVHVAFPTIVAFVLFNAALQRAPAGQANILVGAELGFTALFSWLLFGDSFSGAQLAGLAVVLFSVSGYLWTQARVARPGAASAAS